MRAVVFPLADASDCQSDECTDDRVEGKSPLRMALRDIDDAKECVV